MRRIIDFHSHILKKKNPRFLRAAIGVEEFIAELNENNIFYAVVLAEYLSNKNRIVSNRQILQACDASNRLIPFVSFDISRANFLSELRKLNEKYCFKGVKLYPGYQNFAADDRRLDNLYKFLSLHNKILLVHSGVISGDRTYADKAHPRHLEEVARRFPKLKIVIAHLGNPWIEETVGIIRKNPNVYSDISGLFRSPASENHLKQISQLLYSVLGAVGSGRLLFGSDHPICSYDEMKNLVEELDISDSDKNNIFYENARRLLNLEYNYFNIKKNPFEKTMPVESVKSELNINLGYRCNLSCGYCYNRATGKYADWMPWKRFCRLVARLRKDGLRRVTLVGGEPLLYPYANNAISLLKDSGIHVTVSTNGSLVPKIHPDAYLIHLSPSIINKFEATIADIYRINGDNCKYVLPVNRQWKVADIRSIRSFLSKYPTKVYLRLIYPITNKKSLGSVVMKIAEFLFLNRIDFIMHGPVPYCIFNPRQLDFFKKNKITLCGTCSCPDNPMIEPDGITVRPCFAVKCSINSAGVSLKKIPPLFLKKVSVLRGHISRECFKCSFFRSMQCQNGCLLNRPIA